MGNVRRPRRGFLPFGAAEHVGLGVSVFAFLVSTEVFVWHVNAERKGLHPEEGDAGSVIDLVAVGVPQYFVAPRHVIAGDSGDSEAGQWQLGSCAQTAGGDSDADCLRCQKLSAPSRPWAT